jgi:hypothetical protein
MTISGMLKALGGAGTALTLFGWRFNALLKGRNRQT